jgi:hypothetical protein
MRWSMLFVRLAQRAVGYRVSFLEQPEVLVLQ